MFQKVAPNEYLRLQFKDEKQAKIIVESRTYFIKNMQEITSKKSPRKYDHFCSSNLFS